jgi:Cu/Ag efflux protein CusF
MLVAGAIGGIAAVAGAAQAQTSSHDSHHAAPAAKAVKVASAATSDLSEGEVRKIDKENRKITLKHGPIKNLDMPAMTMVFVAADPALLNKVKVGDKVRFVAANPGGKLTVTEIQPAR